MLKVLRRPKQQMVREGVGDQKETKVRFRVLIDFVSDKNLIANDPAFSKAAVEHYAEDSTLYTYNKNLETVICNLRQEFCII